MNQELKILNQMKQHEKIVHYDNKFKILVKKNKY